MHDRALGRGRPEKQGVAAASRDRSALAVLRAATRRAHVALEAQIPLLSPHLVAQDYYEYLRAIRPVVATLEAEVARSAALLATSSFAWSPRRRLHKLDTDLATLSSRDDVRGMTTSAWPSTAPPADELRAHDSHAARVGMMYVLEGSTLGGQVLRKHLSNRLQLGPQGLQYLSGHGEHTSKWWQRSCEVTEALLRSDAQRQQAARAAVATFAWFARAIGTLPRPAPPAAPGDVKVARL